MVQQHNKVVPISIAPDPEALAVLIGDLCKIAGGQVATCKANPYQFTLPSGAGRVTCYADRRIRWPKMHLEISCWSGATVQSLVLPLPLGEGPERSDGLGALRAFIERGTVLCNLLRVGKRIAGKDPAFAFTGSNRACRHGLPHGELRLFRRRHHGRMCLVIEVHKSAGGKPEILRVPIETVLQLSPDPSDPTGATTLCGRQHCCLPAERLHPAA